MPYITSDKYAIRKQSQQHLSINGYDKELSQAEVNKKIKEAKKLEKRDMEI